MYFEIPLYQALRVKAATTNRTVSELVNEAVRRSIVEDAADLAAFEDRAGDGTVSYEKLLKDLKASGKL